MADDLSHLNYLSHLGFLSHLGHLGRLGNLDVSISWWLNNLSYPSISTSLLVRMDKIDG